MTKLDVVLLIIAAVLLVITASTLIYALPRLVG